MFLGADPLGGRAAYTPDTPEEIAHLLRGKKSGKGWSARCPAHKDDSPSLSIGEGRDGKPLLKCHAACTFEEILAAIRALGGLQPQAARSAPTPKRQKLTRVAEYLYKNADGTPVSTKTRYVDERGEKTFFWKPTLNGARAPLYRLDEIQGKEEVYISEGEKDVDRLWSLGLPATCNAHGASMDTQRPKWTDEDTKDLVAAGVQRVAILRDEDEPGIAHAHSVAQACQQAGIITKLVELPDLPDKKGADVSDWLDAGHTKIELQQAVMDTAVYDLPPADDVEPVEVSKPAEQQERVEKIDLTRYEFSDLGNAERLLACHRDRIRFCSAIGWLMWDGKRWRAMMHSKKGDHLAVMQLAIKAIRTFKEQCVDIADPKRAAQAFKHALTSEGLFRLEAMVELAKGFVEIKMELLDQDAHLLNVANGTLDLRTGELRDHCKDDYLTRVIPVEYHSDAQAPTWIRFLDTIMAGNANLIGYLQRGAGYSLIGLLRDHVLFIPYGVGSNGKSTFLGTVANVLGEYAQGMAPETLMSKKYEGIPNDIARLKGTRFVSALETKRGRQLDESVVKKLTGGDTLTGRFLHKEFFDFEPTHKLWLATNHKPVIKDTTGSIWRRVNLIPFNVVIPDAEQDKALGEKLRAEAPGILAWAVEGCRQWMADGLRTPDEVRVATEQYRQEQDALSEFVALTIEVWPRGWVTIEDIGKAYEDWAFEYGGAEHQEEGKRSTRDITNYLVSTYALTRASKKVDGRAHKVLLGIRLRPPVTEVTDVPVIPTDPFPSRKTGNPVTTVTATPKADTSDPDDLPNSENF